MDKRTMIRVWVVLAVVASVLALAACSGGGDAPSPATNVDAKALVEDRCTKCHGLSNVTNATKTQEQWSSTVERMVQKGATLNGDEQAAVIAYLAETYGP